MTEYDFAGWPANGSRFRDGIVRANDGSHRVLVEIDRNHILDLARIGPEERADVDRLNEELRQRQAHFVDEIEARYAAGFFTEETRAGSQFRVIRIP